MRRRVAALLAVAVLAAGYALLRDDGLTTFRYDGDPAFTLVYDDELISPEDPSGEVLAAFRAERKGRVATIEISPLILPDYEGSVTGLLPVFASKFAADREITVDARARLGGAPGYEIGYELPDGDGTLLFAVPDEAAREGVLLVFEQRQDPARDAGGGRRVSLAMRSALRSFEFGSDRD